MDRLRAFVAQEYQDAALTCAAPMQIIRGGNRSAKTTVAAAKVALACRPRVGLHLSGGIEIISRRVEPLKVLIAGKDYEHIKDVSYRVLFGMNGEGSFIPWEDVVATNWRNKSCGVPETIGLKNGTILEFATSVERDGPQFDIAWLDEQPMFDEHVENMIGRSKMFIWSTWPTATCEPLRKLSEAASPFGLIREFRFRFSDNKAIDEQLADQTRERWAAFGNGEIEARDFGDFPAEEEMAPHGDHD